tara:strand:- start:1318 stop:1476 length:159 start_codon:yes stop_codon:yes gene_type:complete
MQELDKTQLQNVNGGLLPAAWAALTIYEVAAATGVGIAIGATARKLYTKYWP